MKAEAALVEGIAHIVAHIMRIGEMVGFYAVLLAGDGAGLLLADAGLILYLGECNLCFLIV